MKKVTAAFLLLLFTFPFSAADAESTGDQPPVKMPGVRLRATDVIGRDIVTSEKERLGRIVDVLITGEGTIPFLVAEYRSRVIRDQGYRRFLVPSQLFDLTRLFTRGARFTGSLRGIDARAVPYIRRNGTRALNTELIPQVQEFWRKTLPDYRPAAGTGRNAEAYLVTELLDSTVTRNRGSLGEIIDIMIDPETWHAVYIALAPVQTLGSGNRYYAVPFERFQPSNSTYSYLELDISSITFPKAEGFDSDNWPAEPDHLWYDPAENRGD